MVRVDFLNSDKQQHEYKINSEHIIYFYSLGLHYIGSTAAQNEICKEENKESNVAVQGFRMDAGFRQIKLVRC